LIEDFGMKRPSIIVTVFVLFVAIAANAEVQGNTINQSFNKAKKILLRLEIENCGPPSPDAQIEAYKY